MIDPRRQARATSTLGTPRTRSGRGESRPSARIPNLSSRRILDVALILAAILSVSFKVRLGLDSADSENMESTLTLVAARQLTDGPSTLYGPFDGTNPYVLMQAPLYFRATALLAWPLTAAGVDAFEACLYAGRFLSAACFFACLRVVARLAVSDGAPARAGLWAVLLIAATPLVGSMPVTLRPDMLGVMLQTIGLAGVLRVSEDRPRRAGAPLAWAYFAFGLALCVKQHYLVGPAFASMVLVDEWRRGRLGPGPIVMAHLVALGVVASIYGVEAFVTSGRIVRAVVEVPRRLRDVTSGSWGFVGLVASTAARRGLGLIVIGVACAWATSRRSRGRRLDTMLLVYAALELVLMVLMCLSSSGGWYNYALQATLILAVLIGRALGRIVEFEWRAWKLAPVGLAALALVAVTGRAVAVGMDLRGEQARSLRALLASPSIAGRPTSEIYFAGVLQPWNRRFGRRELLHDEWLYGAFESVGAAEPRGRWLGEALSRGLVRVVVAPAEVFGRTGTIPGLRRPLVALGYVRSGRVGTIDIWERR